MPTVEEYAARYGTGVSIFVRNAEGRPDLDANFLIISGPRVVVESVALLWLSPRGSLITNPDAGIDVREWLSYELDDSPGGLAVLRARLVAEARRDPRVGSIDVELVLDARAMSLTIKGSITPSDDENERFDFVLTVGKTLTPELVFGVAA